MKRKVAIFLILAACTLTHGQWSVVRSQSDWHSGPGLTDTTDQWGYRFSAAGGINYVTIPLMLLADPASYDYTNWVPHTIDNSPEIGTFNWCVHPADINGDGNIDIVANWSDNADATTGYVVWYEGPASGWTYTRHNIYTYTAVDRVSGAFPADIDNDGDIDIVAGDNTGLNWFENDGSGGGWTRHRIYTTSAMQYSAWYYDVADADGDGWKDILVTEIETNLFNADAYCTIYWNTGTGPDYFNASSSLVLDHYSISSSDGGQFWRAVFFDPDPTDGLLDVAYEKVYITYDWLGMPHFANDSLIIKIQSTTRSFSEAYFHFIDALSTGMGHDGLWPNDFDDDGDQDLVVAVADNFLSSPGYFFLIQSDPGDMFSYHFLVNDPNSAYGDGAIMFDMDNDGMADIVGTCDSVGYFRRTGTGYTDFTLFPIDNIPGTIDSTHFASHWVFPYNLDRGECSGDADIDLIVTFDNGLGAQELRVYENEMFTYVATGSLYSAILGIPLPGDTCVACSLFWEGCEIPEYTIEVSGRVGRTLADCQSASWSAPVSQPYHTSSSGGLAGEVHSPTDTLWVQYRIEISRTGSTTDLSPLIDSVWVKVYPIPCECESIRAMWVCPTPCYSYSACAAQVMQIVLWTDSTAIDTDAVYFSVNDGINPPYVLPSTSGYVSSFCYDSSCDSVFFEISGITWTDGATVTINLDSAYTTDGCITRYH